MAATRGCIPEGIPSSWSGKHSWWVSSHWPLTMSSVSAAAAASQWDVCCPPWGFDTPPSACGTPPSAGPRHLTEQERSEMKILKENAGHSRTQVELSCIILHLHINAGSCSIILTSLCPTRGSAAEHSSDIMCWKCVSLLHDFTSLVS